MAKVSVVPSKLKLLINGKRQPEFQKKDREVAKRRDKRAKPRLSMLKCQFPSSQGGWHVPGNN